MCVAAEGATDDSKREAEDERPLRGETPAHVAFRSSLRKIRTLLKASVAGIEGEAGKLAELEAKFHVGDLEGKTTDFLQKLASDDEQELKIEKVEESDDAITFDMSDRAAALILVAIRNYAQDHATLVFDLHNALCVYAWSTFEGYIQSVLLDIFTKHPSLIVSSKTITYEEALSAGENIIGYLAQREVESIGRLGFRDLNTYLGSRIKASITSKHVPLMVEVYFLRNVIAHAAGRVRVEQMLSVPKDIQVKDGQIRLESEYLDQAISCLESAARALDDRLYELYYKP